jgi:ATP-binding cassette subfamily B protein
MSTRSSSVSRRHPLFRDNAIAAQSAGRERKQNSRAPWKVQRPRKTPLILQDSATDCGAACLAMILSTFGSSASCESVRQFMDVQRDGTSARVILAAGKEFGLEGKAVSLDIDGLSQIPLPAILHWGFNHFVVLTEWNGKKATILDPGFGRMSLSTKDLDVGFTGVALLFEPLVAFRPEPEDRAHWNRMFAWIRQARLALGKVVSLSFLLKLLALGLPILTAAIVDRVLPLRRWDLLATMSVGVVVFMLAHFAGEISRSYVLSDIKHWLDERMMNSFFDHLLHLPFRYFQSHSTGDLLMRLGSNGAIRDILSQQFLALLLDVGFLAVYLVVLGCYQPSLALVVVALCTLQIALAFFSVRVTQNLVQAEIAAQSRSQSYLVQAIRGIATIKVSCAEGRVSSHWKALLREQLVASSLRDRRGSLMSSAISAVNVGGPLLVLLTGAYMVLNGGLTLGTMLAVNALAAMCLGPLASVVSNVQGLQLAGTHLKRVDDVFRETPEELPPSGMIPARVTGSIELRNISFRYGAHSPLVLDDVTLEIPRGSFVAIVGVTGSGKSTLAKLMLGLYPLTTGSIYIDGRIVSTSELRTIRSEFGVTLQGGFVFNGSIRDNISLNRPDMPLEQVQRAARLAEIDADIEKMPMGYETVLAEFATNLSGGQLQRLCIARALAGNPEIMIFDEATSELDAKTERRIHSNLSGLNCTRIVIAHRLGSVANADKIVVMAAGKIVESGTHENLLAKGCHYQELYSAFVGA